MMDESLKGGLRLPGYLSDGMVLQRNREIWICGEDRVGQRVEVRFGREVAETMAGEDGRFGVCLMGREAEIGGVMEVLGSRRIVIRDVCVGDVFLLAGQSNMELPIRRVWDMYEEELAAAEKEGYPYIRQFQVEQRTDFMNWGGMLEGGSWKRAEGETLYEFSAVGYFVAQEIWEREQKKRKNEIGEAMQVPIGLIQTAVGGTTIQAWMGWERLQGFEKYQKRIEQLKEEAYIHQIEEANEKNEAKWMQELELKNQQIREAGIDEWKRIGMPAQLTEVEGIGSYCGTIWFRKTFYIEEAQLLQEWDEIMLHLGTMVDADRTYLNGVLVGQTDYQYPPRKYPVSAEQLNVGENELLVELTVQGGQGEWVAGKNYELVLKRMHKKVDGIPLDGIWDYALGGRMEPVIPRRFLIREASGLYNGMIQPLAPLAFSAVLWYQGESNTEAKDDPWTYGVYLEQMIQEWRVLFRDQDLPFICVQLADYREASVFQEGSLWAVVRNEQRKIAAMDRVWVTTALGLGEWNDLHPVRKKELGQRLARCIRNAVYQETVVCKAPTVKRIVAEEGRIKMEFAMQGSMWKKPDDGNCIELQNNLQMKQSPSIHQKFYLLDQKGNWSEASGTISLLKNSNICTIEWNHAIKPVIIRYAWADCPQEWYLVNQEGLPVLPFEETIES